MNRDVAGGADGLELSEYADLLAEVRAEVLRARTRAVRAVNRELVDLYLQIGRLILERQEAAGPGNRVVAQLARDLAHEFPGARGFSARNLHYCRKAASIFTGQPLQQLAAELPWGHVMVLVDRVGDDRTREWYAVKAVEHGWSRNVLITHIATNLHERVAVSPTPARIPAGPVESDLVRDLVKDPYRLDFLGLDEGFTERQLEDALVLRITRLIEELGQGFAFVGRQVHVQVGDSDFYLDLLFYHLRLRRFVVIELKTGPATPEAIGKLGFYCRVVDDQFRRQEHGDATTIGILMTASRDDVVVEYALQAATGPMAAVTYQALPADVRQALPSPVELVAALSPSTLELDGDGVEPPRGP